MGGVDVLVAAGDEHDDERPEQTLAPALGIRHIAKSPEIDLGDLARLALGHADGDPPPLSKATVLDREAVQRAVGDVYAAPGQKLVHFGEPQPSLLAERRRQPLSDLLLVGKKIGFCVAWAAITRRAQVPPDLGGQLFTRLLDPRGPAQTPSRVLVAANRAPAVTGLRGNRRLAFPGGSIAAGHSGSPTWPPLDMPSDTPPI
jgi:hypothetical protein